MKSTQTRYGTVAVTLHWLSALSIFALLGLGFRASALTGSPDKTLILTAHVTLGSVVLILTLFRIIWWAFADQKPKPLSDDPAWQQISGKAVHILFYVVILGMCASGIGMVALSGAGAILFGGQTSPLPNFWDYLPRTPHGLGARFMLVLMALHIGAALYHHFIRKDGLIWRMWFSADRK